MDIERGEIMEFNIRPSADSTAGIIIALALKSLPHRLMKSLTSHKQKNSRQNLSISAGAIT